MQPSLSYRLTLLVIRLKGVKRDFSRAPIDVDKIRREDVHLPSGRFFRGAKKIDSASGSEKGIIKRFISSVLSNFFDVEKAKSLFAPLRKRRNVSRFNVSSTVVTNIQQPNPTGKLVIFVHGGAFVAGPTLYHWQAVQALSESTQHDVWMCDYPKAPACKIAEISHNIDGVYAAALEKYAAKDITLIGDSVGGTLVLALVQRIVQQGAAVPRQLILISPVLDATFSNPQIAAIDKTDPILSRAGVRSAKEMCAGDVALDNPMISPIYGAFEQFPRTVLFLAENDITYPDQLLAVEKLAAAQADMEVVTGVNMPHIWPYLPVMREAKAAMQAIIHKVNA
jgi:acetyl esterase/lipase